MKRVPCPVAGTLRKLMAALDETLGADLVGLYLYGSLTQDAFDPKRSDIDCLAVVRRDLTPPRMQRLRRMLATAARTDPLMRRVQMQILIRSRLLRPGRRGALYQFGTLKRIGSDGNPLVWMNVLASGVTLAGPRAGSILPRITASMVRAALAREVGYLGAEIGDPASRWRQREFYRAYAVLTLCRILYTLRNGDVVSKPRAAAWALQTLPARWHVLIRAALASDRGRPARLPASAIAPFISFAAARVQVAGRGSRLTPARDRVPRSGA